MQAINKRKLTDLDGDKHLDAPNQSVSTEEIKLYAGYERSLT